VSWLGELHATNPVAHAIGILAMICVVGMALGSVKIRGVGLGTAGLLFAGLLVGHLGKPVDHATLDFVKELGLILFVFTIGLQLGPGFFAAWQQHGVRLNLLAAPGGVTYRRVVLTSTDVLGKTVSELGLEALGVVVTRVTRGDLELGSVPGLRLKFGDVLQVVGTAKALDQAADVLGNSVKHLNETHFIPFFLGIFAGILLGTTPISVPGLPQPVRLGLAGGPLVVALLLGRVGHLGRLVWHVPLNANLAFREFGIAMFLAAVGLAAGPQFFGAVFRTTGLRWLLLGLVVTTVPLLVVGLFARLVLRTNFTIVSGVLAGSVTDPPALAFATGTARSDAPSVAYATVYPVAMLLRIEIAQVLTLLLCS